MRFPSYKSTILADWPRVYWRCNSLGVTPDEAVNFVGNAIANRAGSVTATGASVQPGMTGDLDPSLRFDGVAGGVVGPPWNVTVGSSAFSIECWANPESGTRAAHGHVMGMLGTAKFKVMQLSSTATIQCRIANDSATTVDITPSPTLLINEWNHLVFTYDGANAVIYQNGVSAGSAAATGTLTGAFRWEIGWDGAGQNHWFLGRIDEAAIYSYTLSAAQVRTHYDARWLSAQDLPLLDPARRSMPVLQAVNRSNTY